MRDDGMVSLREAMTDKDFPPCDHSYHDPKVTPCIWRPPKLACEIQAWIKRERIRGWEVRAIHDSSGQDGKCHLSSKGVFSNIAEGRVSCFFYYPERNWMIRYSLSISLSRNEPRFFRKLKKVLTAIKGVSGRWEKALNETRERLNAEIYKAAGYKASRLRRQG